MKVKDEIILGQDSFYNNIIQIDNVCNIFKSTLKIELKDGAKSSGFFIKYKINEKPFYCMMTNEHVITYNLTNKGEEILIKYDNEKKELLIELNQMDRHILCFKEMLGIDITIIQIIPKDKVDDSFFLSPIENDKNYDYYLNKHIQIIQYPGGKNLSMSEGKILNVDNFIFHHNAGTLPGSSGSPIILKGEEKVLGIHKGALIDKSNNVGIFIIGIISEIIGQLKREGKGREYYENGTLKYEGNFKNDEYDDVEGVFYYENGNIYIGEFKNGKQCGVGCIVKPESSFDKIINKTGDILNKVNNYFVESSKGLGSAIGSFLGYRCKKCKHHKKEHYKIVDNIYECKDCPKDDNICELEEKKEK